MHCRDNESLILAERDGVLTTEQHAALSDHLATCPACRQLRAQLAEAMTALQTDAARIAVPDADQEWSRLRAQLPAAPHRTSTSRRLAPVLWFGVPLATAAALLFTFLSPSAIPPVPTENSTAQSAPTPLPSENADTPTIAYVDQESGWLVVWASDAGNTGNG